MSPVRRKRKRSSTIGERRPPILAVDELSAKAGQIVIADVVLLIVPTIENGCARQCWALSYLITSTAKARIRSTRSQITPGQLDTVRRQVAYAMGLVA